MYFNSATSHTHTHTHTHTQPFFLKHIFRLWECRRIKNHKKSKSNFLTIAILSSLLMSLESKNNTITGLLARRILLRAVVCVVSINFFYCLSWDGAFLGQSVKCGNRVESVQMPLLHTRPCGRCKSGSWLISLLFFFFTAQESV